jgi:aldehyde:ferredoxin oxidoreductase
MALTRTTDGSRTTDGYHGVYLHIQLDAGTVGGLRSHRIPLEPRVLRDYLGGAGLGAYLLLQGRSAGVDPLSPEASLAFVFSPLVGSPLTTSAKFAVVGKSPLTDRFNDSLASSGFAIAGKRCGVDAVVVEGRAAEPSILVIDDGLVRLEPAGDLWGLSCRETQARLELRLGKDWRTAVIGPAGERLVRFATISHDGRHAGRGGSGAVLGSKQIKAIALRGSQTCRWADPAGLVAYAKQLSQKSFGPATEKYRELGTAANLLLFNRLKTLPTKNFTAGSFAGAEVLSPEALATAREKTRASCAACTIGCEHLYQLAPHASSGASSGTTQVRLEYENLFALGPLCGVSDADAVLRASQACDALGLDTISTGGTIAFAMECVERGLVDDHWSWLRFGDGAAVLRAIEEIGQRQGIGSELAEGSRRLAARIGQNAAEFAPQVKGLEMPGYEPRGMQTMALGFAVGTRGADHNRSGAYEIDFSNRVDRKNLKAADAALAIETEDKAALMDSLILCKFLRGVFADFYSDAAEMLQRVTGWDVTAAELRQTAKRIVQAKRQFNRQAGWTPEEDTLPERFFRETLRDDDSRLDRQALQAAVKQYHWLRDLEMQP